MSEAQKLVPRPEASASKAADSPTALRRSLKPLSSEERDEVVELLRALGAGLLRGPGLAR
jgi:hypothetical protein